LTTSFGIEKAELIGYDIALAEGIEPPRDADETDIIDTGLTGY